MVSHSVSSLELAVSVRCQIWVPVKSECSLDGPLPLILIHFLIEIVRYLFEKVQGRLTMLTQNWRICT